MNQFQPFSFDSIDAFLEYLPPDERKLVECLREIIFQCIPDAKEKLAYNVPFYYRHSRICYLWPGAVPWGKIKEGVVLGFCKGNLLGDTSYLEKGQRKYIYTKTFYRLKDIDRDRVAQALFDAVVIDEEAKNAKALKRK
jgi:hypothetical protein